MKELFKFINGTQRGFAYGLCDKAGIRYIEDYVDAKGTINEQYIVARNLVEDLYQKWSFDPESVKSMENWHPTGMIGRIYEGEGEVKEK